LRNSERGIESERERESVREVQRELHIDMYREKATGNEP